MTQPKTDDRAAKLRRRVYKNAAASNDGDDFIVALDGRPVRTPGGKPLRVGTGALAAAIADEWNRQGDKVDPTTMPLTQIACTAIDRVAPNLDDIAGQVANYAGTDLICYRTEAPPELALSQNQRWQPLLDWLAAEKGIPLRTTTGILPVSQAPEALARARALVDDLDVHELAAFAVLTQALGSICLAFAIEGGRLTAAEAAELSMLDDTYQSGRWGEDREAMARLRGLRTDIVAAARYLELLRN